MTVETKEAAQLAMHASTLLSTHEQSRKRDAFMLLKKIQKYLAVSLVALFVPTLAYAHPGHGDISGIMYGLAHPLLGADHLLTMVAVGVLAQRLGRTALWLSPAAFLSLMVVGELLGVSGISLTFSEAIIALSVVILGGMIAFNVRLPTIVAAAAIGGFALFHGYAHAIEMPLDTGGLTYAAGFLVSTATLHGVGICLAILSAKISRNFGPSFIRLSGGLTAAAGIGFLVTALGI